MSTHIVKAGESLYSIAASYLIADWRIIYQDTQNAGFRQLRPNPDHIKPGDKIFIPDSGLAKTAFGSKSVQTNSATKKMPRINVRTLRLPVNQIRQDNVRLARKPLSTIKEPPEPLAKDFTPDFAFYEYLAHDFSYLNNQGTHSSSGIKLEKFLYCNDTTTSWAQSQAKPFALHLPQLGSPALYSVSSKRPYARGMGVQPLYYTVAQMPGSDPDNQFQGHGVLAYWLQPSRGNHPILVIRGTEFNRSPDAVADMDPLGVAYSAFIKTRPLFQSLLKTIGRNDIIVVGHSLGGAMVQRVAVDFADSILQAVTFNSPGIDAKTANRFKKIKGPSVTHYVTQGDVVSLAGETPIAGNAVILEGAATARLRELLKDGSVRTVDEVLTQMLVLVFELTYKVDTSKLCDHAIALWLNGGVKAAKKVGAALGDLHSQRLLNHKGTTKTTQVIIRTQASGQSDDKINNPRVEEVRKRYLGTIDIAALYVSVIHQIDVLLSEPVKAALKEMLPFNSNLSKIARSLIDSLVILRVALNEVGGMDGLISKSLRIPLPKPNFKTLQEMQRIRPAVRDNTYVAPKPILISRK